KLRLNTVEPTKMNTTKQESLVVVSMAWRNKLQENRPRIRAMTSAPTAPMAPPSVGVATPMKMVPKTRKIRNSGGIMTKVTRSAISDNSLSFSTLLISAIIQDVTPHTSKTTTTRSSTGTESRELKYHSSPK